MYRPETLYEGNLFHVKNITGIKQLCNHKVLDFAMAFRVRKLFGTFEKRAPEQYHLTNCSLVTGLELADLVGGE